MAIKKSDLYSSLWASCDELRGGMDASQSKDYVLFMLFINGHFPVGHPEMKNGPFKAFVLHHRTGSIVTVGEFDAPDDPELLRVQKLLIGITCKMKNKNQQPIIGKDGREEEPRMFDSVSPFPVPKI